MPPKRRIATVSKTVAPTGPFNVTLTAPILGRVFNLCDEKTRLKFDLANRDFLSGFGWSHVDSIHLSELDTAIRKYFEETPEKIQSRVFCLEKRIKPQLQNVRSLTWKTQSYIPGALFSIHHGLEPAMRDLCSHIVPQCTSVTIEAPSHLDCSTIYSALNAAKLVSLELGCDPSAMDEIFSSKHRRKFPNLRRLLLSFGYTPTMHNYVSLLDNVIRTTCQLEEFSFTPPGLDPSRQEALLDSVKRFCMKHENSLRSLLVWQLYPKDVLQLPDHVDKIDWDRLNKKCLSEFHVPLSTLKLGFYGWLETVNLLPAGQYSVNAQVFSSVWKLVHNSPHAFTDVYGVVGSIQLFKKFDLPKLNFFLSITNSLFDTWELTNGSVQQFGHLCDIIGNLITAAKDLSADMMLFPLFTRAKNLIRRFPSLFKTSSGGFIWSLFECPDIDNDSLDVSHLMNSGLLSNVLTYDPEILPEILRLGKISSINFMWHVFHRVSSDDRYGESFRVLLRLGSDYPEEVSNGLTNILRGLKDTFALELNDAMDKTTDDDIALPLLLRAIMHREENLVLFGAYLLKQDRLARIMPTVKALFDAATVQTFINGLWHAVVSSSTSLAALTSNGTAVKNVLGRSAVTDKLRRFIETENSGNEFTIYHKLKMPSVKKALKAFL